MQLDNGEVMAPGHVYQSSLGTGIEWTPGEVRLWEKGTVTLTATTSASSAYAFFAGLEHRAVFPTVTHWWFRSAWTQRARVSRPAGALPDGSIFGYMQFVDVETPPQMWTLTSGTPYTLQVPYPPLEAQPVNQPLRQALARMVLMMLDDELAADRWYMVSSLVRRDERLAALPAEAPELVVPLLTLETAFPTEVRPWVWENAPDRLERFAPGFVPPSGDYPDIDRPERPWVLEGLESTSVRDLWLKVQGLRQ